jgi:hypothetical protein
LFLDCAWEPQSQPLQKVSLSEMLVH